MHRVLIVHGHPIVAEAVRRIVVDEGFSGLSATDGRTARQLIEQWRPDALITDVALPDALGYSLPMQARDQGVSTVLIFSEIFRAKAYRRRPARNYGADDFLEIHRVHADVGPKLRAQLNIDASSNADTDPDPARDRMERRVCEWILAHSDRVEEWDVESAPQKMEELFEKEREPLDEQVDLMSARGVLHELMRGAGFDVSTRRAM